MSVNAPVIERDSWTAPPTVQRKDALVLQHVDLVRRIAYHMMRRMPHSIEVDDLIQTGMLGLLEAAQRYECRAGSTFAAYATRRIRGAILDSLRRSDWGPRSLRRRLRDIDDAKLFIEQRTGEAAKARTIAESVGMTLDGYFRAMQYFSQSIQMSLDEPPPFGAAQTYADPTDGRAGPVEEMEQEELRCAIAAAIAALPETERVILLLYYDEECLMREIGIRLAVSESRICQIHKRTIERLRAATQN
jgi:RNA polymerase sigma factor for flagellar operon FliA